MRHFLFIPFFCFILTVSAPARAATLIESQNMETRETQKTWIQGSLLRVETGETSQYMLMDFNKRTMYLINQNRQTILDMSKLAADPLTTGTDPKEFGYRIVNRGKGPVIAGQETTRYLVSWENTVCLEAYTSKRAISSLNLSEFVNGMNDMFPQTEVPAPDDPPCKFAESVLQHETIGLPMRIVQNDTETYLVTRLQKDAEVTPDWFALPLGYQMIDYAQMVLEMTQEKQQGN